MTNAEIEAKYLLDIKRAKAAYSAALEDAKKTFDERHREMARRKAPQSTAG